MESQISSAFIIILVIIALIAIVGNLYYLIALYKSPSLQRRINNYFLGNLAAADLLTGLLAIPMVLTVSIMGSSTPSIICQTQAFLVGWFYGVSLTIAAIISIDRCIIVMEPLRYPYLMTSNRFKIIIILPWVLSLLIYVMPLLGLEDAGLGRYKYKYLCWLDNTMVVMRDDSNDENYEDEHSNMSKDENRASHGSNVITLIYLIHLILAFAIIVICYGVIFKIACQKSLACNQNRARSITKSIRTTASIVGTNLFCWLPTVIITILDMLEISVIPLKSFIISMIFYILFLTTAATNPIIYIWSSQTLRHKVILTLRCRKNRILDFQQDI